MAAKLNLGEYIGQQVRKAIGEALADKRVLLEQIAKEAASNVTVSTGGKVGDLISILTEAVSITILGAPELAPALAAATAIEDGAGELGAGYGFGYLLGQVGFQIVQPALLPLFHASAAAFTNEIFDPATAAGLAAQGIISPAFAISEAGGGGVDAQHTNDLIEAALNYPDVSVGLELLRRGSIQPADLTKMMTRHGVPAAYQGGLAQLARNLLSPADLALANLRGFMDDATMFSYGAELGINQADMTTLINNTGEPPGLETLLTMYRRQIIDQPTLEHGIRESRVRNEWIPAIEAVRFGPMSTADAARSVVQNFMSEADGAVVAEQNGLTAAHWPILVEAYGRPLSRTEMSELYHRGLASFDDFAQAMRESDLKDKYIQAAFELGRVLIPARQITTAIEHGAMTQDAGIAYLMLQGYTQADAQVIVKTGAAEHHSAQKELTKSDIVALYTDHLMTHDDAHAQLLALGYTAQMVDWILSLAAFKHQASLARSVTSQVKALYQKKDITHDAALAKLVQGGVAREDAIALLDEWDLTHSTPSRNLTEAQTVKAAEDALIPVPNALQRLLTMGYDEIDANLLLLMAGFTPGMIAGTDPYPPNPPPGSVTGPIPQLPPRPEA